MVSIASVAATRPGVVPLWPWGYVAVSAIAVAAVLAAPLASYVFMIALFGLPHVLCELRYCDERFSSRIPRRALWAIGALIVVLAALRIAQAAAVIPPKIAVGSELALGVALAASAAWFMPQRRAIGFASGLALALGIAFAPIATFLAVAWLHNLTPLGFISEIVPRGERRRILLLLFIPFVAVPALVASGLLQEALGAALGYSSLYAPSLFGAGRGPLAAFLTPDISFRGALPLFSAAVVAQSMHYLSVILVMPQLLRRYQQEDRTTIVPWPSWRLFYVAVAILAMLVFAVYAADYKSARAFYSVAAAIHSWIELPIFLLALGAGFRRP